MKIFHLRFCWNEDISDCNPNGVSCLGGVTIGMIATTENKVQFAIAYCSPNDVFSRAIGRSIVEGRLSVGTCWEVDCTVNDGWAEILEEHVMPKVRRHYAGRYEFEEAANLLEALS